MNSSLRKIVVAAIDDQWLKGAKYLVMGYTNKTFVELFYWLYISYGHIKPVDLMNKQDTMQALYHVEDPIEILFGHIKTGQKFLITVNLPFSDHHLA